MKIKQVRVGLFVLIGGIVLAGCIPDENTTPTPTPTPSQPQTIIIDNLDPECTIVAGEWGTADTTDGNGCYGSDFFYYAVDPENVGIVRYTPNITVAGQYTVSLYWSADPNRTAAQPVIVHHAAGDTTYYVNLQEHGNQWYELGRHTFNAGTGGYIEINSNTESLGYCNADAVRLVPDFQL